MQVFLDAIYEHYIIFLIITIFLVLSLIGYFVDKKTRKDSDLKPMFSMIGKKKDPNAPKKEKKKKDKKSKKGTHNTVIVGEDKEEKPVTTAHVIQNLATQKPEQIQMQGAPVQNPIASTPVVPVAAPQPVTPASTLVQQVQTPIQNVQTSTNTSSFGQVPPAQTNPTLTAPNMASTEEDSSPMNFNMTE